MSCSGTVIGYDPGGNGSHGVAVLQIEQGQCIQATLSLHGTADDVLLTTSKTNNLLALGVDTLAAWSTGASGWRTADLWLREQYADIQQSVVSPNGLFGSMGINGMAILSYMRAQSPMLPISETHPKVLYRALTSKKYDYKSNSDEMDRYLSTWLDVDIRTANDHEWDAAVSAYSALQGLTGAWTRDLLATQEERDGRLIWPCGITNYWWPE